MAMPRFTASFTSTNCPPDSSSTRQARSRFLLRTSMSKSSTKPRPSARERWVRKRISNLFVEAAFEQSVDEGGDLRPRRLDFAELDGIRTEDLGEIGEILDF